jgi:hypothetical protein
VETFSKFYTALWNSHNYENKKKGRALNPLDEDENMITLEELTETLQKTRNGKVPEDNLNSELYKYASQEFKLKLLKFLNEIYITGEMRQEWRNAIVIPIFKKRDKKDPKIIEE